MASRFYEMLDSIGSRPGMYLGDKLISILAGWIQGWFAADPENAFAGTVPPFGEFHDWVALRLGFHESTSGYRRMLLSDCKGDEERAFDRFFELFKEFRCRQSRVVMCAVIDESKKPGNWIDTEERKMFPWPARLEMIKYTDDEGVFVRYFDKEGNVYDRDEYCLNTEIAFMRTRKFVQQDEWVSS